MRVDAIVGLLLSTYPFLPSLLTGMQMKIHANCLVSEWPKFS